MLARAEMGESCTTLDEVRRSKPLRLIARVIMHIGRRRDGAPPTLSLSAASRLRGLSSLTSCWKSPKLSGRGLGFAADFRGYR
jgi:hypothetical protein